jgi:hypothetical protein
MTLSTGGLRISPWVRPWVLGDRNSLICVYKHSGSLAVCGVPAGFGSGPSDPTFFSVANFQGIDFDDAPDSPEYPWQQ